MQSSLRKNAGRNGVTYRPPWFKRPPLDYVPKPLRYFLYGLGISLAIYFAVRHVLDRSKVQEQWPQQMQQLQMQEPKVALRVDGWRAFFDFSAPAGSNINYSFVNMTTHDTVYWKGKFHGYKSAYYYAVAPVEYARDKNKGVIMPLSPFEDNRIQAEFYVVREDGRRMLVYWLDSVFAAPKKFTTKGKLSTLTTEEPHDGKAALELLAVADEINSLLPPSKRIDMLLGNREKSNPSGSYERYAQHYLRNMNLTAGSDKIFEDMSLARLLVFHEYSHGYYENMLSPQDRARVKEIYVKWMKEAGFSPYPFSNGMITTKEDLVLFALMEADPMLSLFDESRYLRMLRKGGGELDALGSPWRNEAEFFASCSTNLWANDKEFFEGLAKLEGKNPQAGQVDREAASEIARMWGRHAPFPKEVRTQLGLD